MAYGGHRATTQFQAILRAIEAARPTHPGGVIDLGRNYWGTDLHVTDQRSIAGQPLQLTGGISYDQLDEARKGFLNFAGTQLGVKGALRRDEHNRVYDLDEYLQLQWDPGERWRAMAGARNSLVQVQSNDHLPAPANAGASAVRYSAFNPVAGLTYRAAAKLNLYGAYGKGFETPTLNDLAYRSTDGSLPGLNIGLRPARSDNYEMGIKSVGAALRATLAGFYIDTRDELAVQASSGGRTVYRNIAATRRKGAELELRATLPRGFDGRLAYTHIEAIIPGGRRLPAVPANTLYAALSWGRSSGDFSVTLESLGRARIYVDDLNSDAAAGYWLANLHCDLAQDRHAWHYTEALRVDNLFDRRYVGSVIVNESNSRFFEPEPGRSIYLMVTLRHQ
jgi:iron complex outermembrane receptor protein